MLETLLTELLKLTLELKELLLKGFYFIRLAEKLSSDYLELFLKRAL